MTNKTKEKIKNKPLGKILFGDEAYPLTSKSEKDFWKEAIESIMRYMLSSNGSVQHPVFIFAGYSENMEEYLDTNIGLRRRMKLKFMFQGYSPVALSRITLCKLLKCKIRFPFGAEDLLTECLDSIPKNVRSFLNPLLCSDLIKEVRMK